MKIFKQKFVLFYLLLIVPYKQTTQQTTNLSDKKSNLNSVNKHQDPRKLFFSPYLNSFEDYSAKKIGQQGLNTGLDGSQDYLGATPVGQDTKNMSSIIPGGFSGGYTLPGSGSFPMGHLGNTQNVQTSSLYNPLGGNPILQGNNFGMGMNQGQVYQGRPLNGTSITQIPLNGSMQNNQNQQPQEQKQPEVSTRLYQPPKIKVQETCESVKTQAVNIANKVLEQQFFEMSEFVTNFLSQSKYIMQMGELKLTRKLRKSLYRYMNRFSSLDFQDINFGSVQNKLDLSEKQLLETFKDIDDEEVLEKPKLDSFVNKI